MEAKERVRLIRMGNEAFNNGDYTTAEKIFMKTAYKDGLERIGDYLYYEKKMPLSAFKYYKMTGSKSKVDEIFSRMVFAMKSLIAGKSKEDMAPKIHLEPTTVHPMLKLAAEEILRENKVQ